MDKILERWFPKLRASGYVITSDSDSRYNCFAFAAGDERRWWDPKRVGRVRSMQGHWFDDIPPECSVDAFVAAYGKFGFKRCKTGDEEPGFEKIAIYVDTNGKPTHAAKQLANGRWASKASFYKDFAHFLDSLEGEDAEEYGKATIFLKRLRSSTPATTGQASA